ncbi:MAG: hypothetical protein COA67_08030 [Lutibacter sp.]|nr:MAG: hypothetical protein COA67_08030 [Lutibacter sp.]
MKTAILFLVLFGIALISLSILIIKFRNKSIGRQQKIVLNLFKGKIISSQKQINCESFKSGVKSYNYNNVNVVDIYLTENGLLIIPYAHKFWWIEKGAPFMLYKENTTIYPYSKVDRKKIEMIQFLNKQDLRINFNYQVLFKHNVEFTFKKLNLSFINTIIDWNNTKTN